MFTKNETDQSNLSTTDRLRKEIEEFVCLSEQELDFVLDHFQLRHFKKHQIILHEGDNAQHEYFVLDGLLRVTKLDATGKEHILQFGMENRWITDSEAYHTQSKATLTIDCLEKTTAFSLTLEQRDKLCQALPKMETFFLKKTTLALLTLQKRILCFLSSNASDRYHHILSVYPGLIQRVPKAMIASYLGVSRETLSRLSKTNP
ncbi:cAMP-binding domain of CRP or a regulatory subunit of cAMP-dependent protein kinases [Algoriphagus locisalis]|uniref:cAMP-binding domain of CRP or a regulatory subunit of cAMP-dependent protein kinases n=1 Tax=Algoriphagus locisalis TaxID=305507 RepID=A0A1I7E493_9BACT|nr:Crp/Fnr family transcriptional regulator [Algoriphagus locisalis]SFU18752.1 cAMP-binding domain of CRP or a regulatory subunit of cAMP-dependent protein kinases [Algoriphagus locisalis]